MEMDAIPAGLGELRSDRPAAADTVYRRFSGFSPPALLGVGEAVSRRRTGEGSIVLYCAGQGLRIRCNAVFPGAILTPMWEPLLGSGAEREARM